MSYRSRRRRSNSRKRRRRGRDNHFGKNPTCPVCDRRITKGMLDQHARRCRPVRNSDYGLYSEEE